MKRCLKKTLSILEDLLFIAVLAFLCIMLYSVRVNHSVSIFNYRFYRIVSNSMEPTLSPNSCIISKSVPESQLEIGDIITFISHDESIYGRYNTHRIYDIEIDEKTGEKLYVTKGDFFDRPDDSRVRYKDIKGKYVKRLPFSKAISFLVIRLANSKVYFVIIILPLVFCLLTYIYKLIGIIVYGPKED